MPEVISHRGKVSAKDKVKLIARSHGLDLVISSMDPPTIPDELWIVKPRTFWFGKKLAELLPGGEKLYVQKDTNAEEIELIKAVASDIEKMLCIHTTVEIF